MKQTNMSRTSAYAAVSTYPNYRSRSPIARKPQMRIVMTDSTTYADHIRVIVSARNLPKQTSSILKGYNKTHEPSGNNERWEQDFPSTLSPAEIVNEYKDLFDLKVSKVNKFNGEEWKKRKPKKNGEFTMPRISTDHHAIHVLMSKKP